MKPLKLFVSVATMCLLVAASGTAMAVDCAGGVIANQEVDQITVDGEDCIISNVTVTGDIEVNNSDTLVMVSNNVVGNIRVLRGGDVTLVANTTTAGNIVVRRNARANVVLNNALAGSIVVAGTINKAEVNRNFAVFTILCRNNGRLDAFENEAGDVECRALGGGLGGPGPF
jgi:hypothetical protein